MHWLLHIPGQPVATIGESPLRIGSDPASEIYLAQPGVAPLHARLIPDAAGLLWIEPAADDTAAVHVNGRRIIRGALLAPGSELHLGSCALRLSSAGKPDAARRPASQPINFSGRVLLRALSGAEAGRGHVLVNSLCIGRSDLSEVRIDDTALAERQILLQRQGNDIFVKNLSPVLEMRVDGWVCEEAVLQPGAHISIEQHRFRFEAPTGETATQIKPEMAEPLQSVNAKDTTPADPARRIFSPAQWILLAVAVAISGFFIILLSFSP